MEASDSSSASLGHHCQPGKPVAAARGVLAGAAGDLQNHAALGQQALQFGEDGRGIAIGGGAVAAGVGCHGHDVILCLVACRPGRWTRMTLLVPDRCVAVRRATLRRQSPCSRVGCRRVPLLHFFGALDAQLPLTPWSGPGRFDPLRCQCARLRPGRPQPHGRHLREGGRQVRGLSALWSQGCVCGGRVRWKRRGPSPVGVLGLQRPAGAGDRPFLGRWWQPESTRQREEPAQSSLAVQPAWRRRCCCRRW